jgi:hypothetical protein
MMRRIEALVAVPIALDFSSSRGGRHASTSVHAGDVRLINALDLIEFDVSATQVLVCEACGHVGCEPGGWVALRRFGEFVVWVPAFPHMDAGHLDQDEHRPPAFLSRLGAPCFGASAWAQLRAWRSGVPALDDLPPISAHEVAQTMQWLAPGRVLGTPPEVPHVQSGAVVAVTDGMLETEVLSVNATLSRYFGDHDACELPCTEDASVIEFWLDRPRLPAWRPFGRVAGQLRVLVEEAR